jgi:hypothetical protein
LIVGNIVKSFEDGWLLSRLKMTNEHGTRTIEEETFIHKDAVVVYLKVVR